MAIANSIFNPLLAFTTVVYGKMYGFLVIFAFVFICGVEGRHHWIREWRVPTPSMTVIPTTNSSRHSQ